MQKAYGSVFDWKVVRVLMVVGLSSPLSKSSFILFYSWCFCTQLQLSGFFVYVYTKSENHSPSPGLPSDVIRNCGRWFLT